jgi:DNA-binding NarL/FixJ family response regulator
MTPRPPGNKAAVWVVEDHTDCRRTLAEVLNRSATLSCPQAFGSCEEALAALEREPLPEVILLDVGLPGMSGLDGIARLKALAPETQIIILTVYDDDDKVFQAICAGASGYLLKTLDEDALTDAVHEVLRGGSPLHPRVARMVLNMFASLKAAPQKEYGLSAREKAVLELMVKGFITKEIADQLGLSYHTVDNHLRGVYAKLHVHTRTGAVAKALSEHLFKT